MPLHRFRCCNGHTTELIVPLEHSRWQECSECNKMAYQILSCPHFKMGGVIPVNDYDDPWEGTKLEGAGEPNTLYYKSDRIQMDMGASRKPGANTKVED